MIAQDRPMILVITTVILMVVFVAWAGIGLLQLSPSVDLSRDKLMSWVPFMGPEEEVSGKDAVLTDKEEEVAADAGVREINKEIMVPATLGLIDYPVVKIEDQVSVFEEIKENEARSGQVFALQGS